MVDEKPPGKGTGQYADRGDEASQEDRLAALEARVAELEAAAETPPEA